MWEMIQNRRVIFGEGKVGEIGEILSWYGLRKAFFAIYDKNAPVYQSICADLDAHGIAHVAYDAIKGEPDLHVINNGRDLYVESGCDCTLAVGGGSVIDTAKAIGMMSTNGGLVEQYQMEGRPVTKLPPFYIAVPTTAGTGAEATKVAVVSNNYNGLKKSLYHTTMIADVTILDPSLTVGLGAKATAATGMDALSHAIESYVSLNANPVTEIYGLRAMELAAKALPVACTEPGNLQARGDMLVASYFGGVAISAGIGIAHIMAQPVGAMYKIPHGDACSIFLPLAMEFNIDHATCKYADVARALGVEKIGASDMDNAKRAIEEVRRIRSLVGAPDTLAPYLHGEKPDLDFVVDTVKKTTGHITCNPRPVDAQVYRDIFEKAM
ncbi:iron-containing alcohol dehydrogenase [Anaerotruncus rubiinfantis]|uniref:iron-containing alcohol dehydrogenase n=2 Tax=Anaerotruncus rubiinfantis TaxID=1720200 RepID=UPI00189A4E06|nr:iron-containing alcohol dehydrogenase [Anaerotruncus rubiinfantis]